MAIQQSTKLCECGCGKPTNISTRNKRGYFKGMPQNFIKGHSAQTQCIKHGHSAKTKSPTYQSWQHMLGRCANPSNDSHYYYGARGIRVCRRWLKFENFLADMGERPHQKTLDRYPNNNGNYEPKNCRWATRSQQQNNRRSNRLICAFGRTRTLAQWARETGIHFATLDSRLRRGTDPETALSLPVHRRPPSTSKRASDSIALTGSDTAIR